VSVFFNDAAGLVAPRLPQRADEAREKARACVASFGNSGAGGATAPVDYNIHQGFPS
jgi:hypothetical protein